MTSASGPVSSGSFIDGNNPLHESVPLFLVQIVVIVTVARIFGQLLKYLNQPAVIAEVVGGIFLGPTVLGRIPEFNDTLFPKTSLPLLYLAGNFGLILYLFLVGMELDPDKVASQFSKSWLVSVIGIVFPFSLGIAISKLIYDLYGDPSVPFTSFFIFLGVAMSITAFPVLARILAARKLLGSAVGQMTLAAAASDDAIAWCLLVIVVALINNPKNVINGVYVFLIIVAFTIFLFLAIRPFLSWLVRRSSKDQVASQPNMFILFMLVFTASFFTQAVGVHAIFGAFLVGLITPHENGFAIAIAEKLEDLVTIILIPIYFGLSGLQTNLLNLDDANAWGVVFLVILVAVTGKVVGCYVGARLSKVEKRESLAIGILMNTKGLVELIVLNLGLQGGVITPKIFSIFVIMALFTTFMTVPLISWIYPYRFYLGNNLTGVDTDHRNSKDSTADTRLLESSSSYKIMICLTSMKVVPPLMNIANIISNGKKPVELFAIRLIELGNRLSNILMASDPGNTVQSDPVIGVFKTFAQLENQSIKTRLEICNHNQYASNIARAAFDYGCDLVIFPIDIGAQTYPNGWNSTLIEVLSVESNSTIGILCDRGFGCSSSEPKSNSNRLNELVIPMIRSSSISVETGLKNHGGSGSRHSFPIEVVANSNNMRIFFPFFGENHDDIEALLFISHLNHANNCSLDVLVINEIVSDPFKEFVELTRGNELVNITYEVSKEEKLYDLLNMKLLEFESKDLVVLSDTIYSGLKSADRLDSIKDLMVKRCKASFLVVRAPIKTPALVSLVV